MEFLLELLDLLEGDEFTDEQVAAAIAEYILGR